MFARLRSTWAIAASISSMSLRFFSMSKREILLMGIFRSLSMSSSSSGLNSSSLKGAKPVTTALFTSSAVFLFSILL